MYFFVRQRLIVYLGIPDEKNAENVDSLESLERDYLVPDDNHNSLLVNDVEKNGQQRYIHSPMPIAKAADRITPNHHDRQKSQLNISATNLGAWTSIYSRAPVFDMRSIVQLATSAINATVIIKLIITFLPIA